MTAWSSTSSEARERPVPAGGSVRGSLTPPPSKSLTQRYLLAALLAEGESVIEGPLRSADTEATRRALTALGALVEERPGAGELRVVPGPLPARAEIDCGANGTLLRLLTGVGAVLPGRWTLDGTARLRERPIGPLGVALCELGARVRYLGRTGFAPLEIVGGALSGGRVAVDAGVSSQFVSALLLAAVRCSEPVELSVDALVSAPYVELTVRSLELFGARIGRSGRSLRVTPAPLTGRRLRVEPDLSSACYPAAAAALTGGRVRLHGVRSTSAQGDAGFFALLRRMGAAVRETSGGLEVAGKGTLRAIEADLGDLPDQVPTLAALAPFAHGVTKIRGVPHLRLKESDRLAAMARQLARLGAIVSERSGGLEIPGVWALSAPPTQPVTVDASDDHRIAMALALVGLRRPGLRLSGWRSVEKSYPAFWEDLETLLAGRGQEAG